METKFIKSVEDRLNLLTQDKQLIKAYINKHFYNISYDNKLENKLSLIQL